MNKGMQNAIIATGVGFALGTLLVALGQLAYDKYKLWRAESAAKAGA